MSDQVDAGEARAIPGDRGPAVVARRLSLQGKLQNGLALAVVALLGGGFLAWYYTHLAVKPPPVEVTRAEAATRSTMTLPPLGPAPARPKPVQETPLVEETSAEGQALLNAPADPLDPALAAGPPAADPRAAAHSAPPAPDAVLQRRLDAPVLIRGTGSYRGPESMPEAGRADAPPAAGLLGPSWASPSGPALGGSKIDPAIPVDGEGRPRAGLARGSASDGSTGIARMLRPSRTGAVAAGVVAERRYLLAKGAFIDCTLETAIDSSLPGMTTCITATDVWSADGSVVLLERGTKLVGETRGEVAQGQERLFVLWSEARTPNGVIVELASPGTDGLGRSGVTGEVDTRFRERFGAAILISLIEAGTAALIASQTEGDSSVVIAPQGASNVVSEVVRQTVNIPPTIRVAQGGRMQVLVARDVSFAEVYSLARR